MSYSDIILNVEQVNLVELILGGLGGKIYQSPIGSGTLSVDASGLPQFTSGLGTVSILGFTELRGGLSILGHYYEPTLPQGGGNLVTLTLS